MCQDCNKVLDKLLRFHAKFFSDLHLNVCLSVARSICMDYRLTDRTESLSKPRINIVDELVLAKNNETIN